MKPKESDVVAGSFAIATAGIVIRQMTLILGAPLARAGFDVVAIENLGYGATDVAKGFNPGYGDWIRLVLAFTG